MNTLEAIIPWNEQTQTGDSGQTSANKINGNFSELKNESERIDSNVNKLGYYALDYTNSKAETRLQITENRKKGVILAYFSPIENLVCEKYYGSTFDDLAWSSDGNWKKEIDPNNYFLSGIILNNDGLITYGHNVGTYLYYDSTGIVINGITYNSGYVNTYRSGYNNTFNVYVQELNTLNGEIFYRVTDDEGIYNGWFTKYNKSYIIDEAKTSIQGDTLKTVEQVDSYLGEFVSLYNANSVQLTTKEAYRLRVPSEKRTLQYKGYILTYMIPVIIGGNTVYKNITEQYIGNTIDDNTWKLDANWIQLDVKKELTATTAINIADGVNNLDLTLPAGYIIDEIIINNIETNLSGLKCVVDPSNTNISILYDKYLSDSYVGYCFKTLGDQIIYQVDKTIRFNCLGNTGMTVIVKIKTGY